MVRKFLMFAAMALVAVPAYAASAPTQVFEKAVAAYRSQDKALYRSLVTRRSLPWVEKMEQYPLYKALPETVAVIGESVDGTRATVRVGTRSEQGKSLEGNFILHRETGGWRLDLPDTFQQAMGPKWQDTLNMTDRMLAAMRAQMPPEQFEAFQEKSLQQLREGLTRPKK